MKNSAIIKEMTKVEPRPFEACADGHTSIEFPKSRNEAFL